VNGDNRILDITGEYMRSLLAVRRGWLSMRVHYSLAFRMPICTTQGEKGCPLLRTVIIVVLHGGKSERVNLPRTMGECAGTQAEWREGLDATS
jgi:hypothetical protein